jgi:hypothetical protein
MCEELRDDAKGERRGFIWLNDEVLALLSGRNALWRE